MSEKQRNKKNATLNCTIYCAGYEKPLLVTVEARASAEKFSGN